MSDTDQGQVTTSAAEVYNAFFVPALFAQWTDTVLGVGEVQAGHRVLDVGCGTGVLAGAARARVGGSGSVVGVDPNEAMLGVAQRVDPSIDWHPGVAENLPFPNDFFHRTISQFALMFFTDRKAALNEMRRVTKPDGRIAVAVWDRLENNSGYSRLTDLVEELFGPREADALRAPFAMGDSQLLTRMAADSLDDPVVTTHRGVARFKSLDSWLHTEIRGWTLAESIDDDGFGRLVSAAQSDLAEFAGADGVAFDVSALIVSGRPASP